MAWSKMEKWKNGKGKETSRPNRRIHKTMTWASKAQGVRPVLTCGRRRMMKLMVLIGAVFVLLGIVAESLYITSAKVAYNGAAISTNAYMVSGLFLIILGLALTLSGARIPKIRIPQV